MEHLGNFDYFLGLCIMDGHFTFNQFPLFLSNEGGNRWIIDKTVDFMEYSRYFQMIYPSQANSHKG